MQWKNTFKVLAVINGLILFSLFMLVKTNYIDIGFLDSNVSTQQVVENSISLSPEIPIDTLPKMDSVKLDSIAKRNMRLLGSKSGVLIDIPTKTEKKKKDTVRKKKTTKQ
ncbi:MAG: hypothetical protein WBP58_03625 [Chitinophagaceae bacterium]